MIEILPQLVHHHLHLPSLLPCPALSLGLLKSSQPLPLLTQLRLTCCRTLLLASPGPLGLISRLRFSAGSALRLRLSFGLDLAYREPLDLTRAGIERDEMCAALAKVRRESRSSS